MGRGFRIGVCALLAVSASAAFAGVAGAAKKPNPDPGVPTRLKAVARYTSLTISWNQPSSSGAGPVTGYRLVDNLGSPASACESSATSCVVSGLKPGKRYSIKVQAYNSVGDAGPFTKAVNVRVGIPDPPTGVTGQSGNASTLVSWNQPALNPSVVTGYTVSAEPGGQTCTTVVRSASPTACTVEGLANGTAYTFSVRSKDAYGISVSAAPSPPVVPMTIPEAPIDVIATGYQNSQASVSWTPSDDGGSTPSFTVISAPPGGSCETVADTCTVSGLTDGQAYAFTVIAINVVGAGPASSPSSPVTPSAAPGAPTDVAVASPANGSATVSWGPPAYDGGNPVVSYQVSASPGGAACTSTDLSDLSCTVSGLSPTTAYTFWVTATNPSGTGPGGYATLFVPGCVPAPGSDLVGCNFTDLNLSGVDLDRSDLTGSDLTDANLTDADLTYDTFTDVTLDGADLTGASLDINGHAYGGMSAVGTTFPAGFGVVGGYLVGPGANISGADFTGDDFTGVTLSSDVLNDDNFSGADLSGVDLDRSDLTGSDLTDANLTDADLTYDTFTDVTLDGADLTGASLDINGHAYGSMSAVGTTFPAGFGVVGGYLVGPGANISGADFTGDDFTGVTLSSDVLNDDNFSGADLSGVDLDRSDLTGSDLTDANLTDADLTYDTFTDVTLDGADLTGASLDINGHAYGSMSAVGTTFPAGFGVVGGYLVGPGANISGADFTGDDFTGVTLSSDVLNDDNFSGADLSGVDLDRSDLTGSDLTDANLTGADLTYDTFTDVTLDGAVFDGTVCPDGSNSNDDNGTCLNNL